jgi:hypothetical protein
VTVTFNAAVIRRDRHVRIELVDHGNEYDRRACVFVFTANAEAGSFTVTANATLAAAIPPASF